MPSILSTEKLSGYVFDRTYLHLTHVYSKFRNRDNPSILKDIESNKQKVKTQLGASNIVLLNQVHGNLVVDLDQLDDPNIELHADAMLTTKLSLALGIYTADCVPVILYSTDAKIIGAAHCGWPSARTNIIDNLVSQMKIKGANAIHAYIGPAIQQNSYEIGPEFYQDFLAEEPRNQQFFKPSTKLGHYMFDLPGYVKGKLKLAGVLEVTINNDDTYTMSNYPSYRRSTHTGEKYNQNILTTIMIK